MKNSHCFLNLAFAFFLLLGAPSVAFANGGPVRWTDTRPLGGLVPAKPEDVMLVREVLSIKILDSYSYEAHATYYLQKTSSQHQTILFGLPLIVSKNPWEEELSESEQINLKSEEKKNAAKMAGSVKLMLGSSQFSCQLASNNVASAFSQLPILPLPSGQKWYDEEQEKFEVNENVKSQTIDNWCVAEIPLPAETNSLRLDLRYVGSLIYVDETVSKSPFTLFSERRLVYPLFPAYSWASESFVADVSLSLGPFVGDVLQTTPHASAADGILRWRLSKSDLAGALMVKLGKKNIEFQETATWNVNGELNSRLTTTATSKTSLKDSQASFVVDGKPETAWCFSDREGKPNAEIILQISPSEIKRIQSQSCGSASIYVASGFLNNQRTYEANGKILQAELSTCDNSRSKLLDGLKDVRADYRDAWDFFSSDQTPDYLAAIEKKRLLDDNDWRDLPAQYDLPGYLQSGCVKIRILATKPGETGETCISEIVPVLSCFGAAN